MIRGSFLKKLLLFLTLFLAFKGLILYPFTAVGVDFGKHYIAAQRVLKGESPYTGDDMYLAFNYPQFVAWTNLPILIFKNPAVAEKAWDAANVVLVLLTAFVAAVGYRPDEKWLASHINVPWWSIALFLTIFYSPNTAGLRPGNLSSWVLLFITLLGWAIYRQKDVLTGILLILSALLKVLPIFLLIPYIMARRKKVLIGAGASLGVYFLILLVTGTLKNEVFFITHVLPNVGERWSVLSTSIPYVVTRHFFPATHLNPVAMRGLSVLWSLIVILPYLWLSFRYRRLLWSADGEILFFVIGVILAPLVPPLLEYHHLVWVFPALLLTFHLAQRGLLRGAYLAIAGLGFFWLCISGSLADVIYFPGFPLLSTNAFVLLLLYIVFIIVLIRQRDKLNKDEHHPVNSC
jgi:hypothetical protein